MNYKILFKVLIRRLLVSDFETYYEELFLGYIYNTSYNMATFTLLYKRISIIY